MIQRKTGRLPMRTKYQIAEPLAQVCQLVDIDPGRVLRRAGLHESWLDLPDNGVTAEVYFALWKAVHEEADQPDIEVTLAKGYAHGPFSAPIFAFSCAETVALGLQRLAGFKSLLGPKELDMEVTPDHLSLGIRSVVPGLEVPTCLEVFEVAYLVECIRTFTAEMVVPVLVQLREPPISEADVTEHLGIAPVYGDAMRLVISREDADRPLITRSAALWSTIEPMLEKQMRDQLSQQQMSFQVRGLLLECLPGGCTNADDVARRLNTSKRSLQRKLSEEGTSFQALLTDVRGELAERYLTRSDISLPEISHLLGYRDTSSFFRAFQSWTGKTPGDFRAGGQDRGSSEWLN